MSIKPTVTREDTPVEEIQEAMTTIPRVIVYLKRRSAQGQWNSIGGRTEHETAELLHCETWIEPLCGGGRYRVETMDPSDPAKLVVPPFMCNIEAPPRPVQQIRAALAGMSAGAGTSSLGTPGGYPPMYPYPPYPSPYGYSESEPSDPRQYWAQPPDAVAQEHTRAMRKELEKSNDEHRKERDELLKKIDKLIERQGETDHRNAEALARERDARLEARIEALGRVNTGGKNETTAELVKAAAMFAPVLVALVGSSKDGRALDAQQQQKAQELQLQTITTFMKSNAGGFTDLLKIALPALAPMMIKMFEERSPSKMAELIGTMGESNLTMFSMLGDIMGRVLPDQPDNPWMQVIQQGLESLKSVAEQMAKVSKPGPSRLTGAVAQIAQAAMAPAPTNGAHADQAKAIAEAICQEPSLEVNLRTDEWKALYYIIHRMDAVKDVADKLAAHLSYLHDRQQLPSFFRGVFEDETKSPSSFLRPLLEGLPISQQPEYVKSLLQAFDATFEGVEAEVVEKPIVTPAPR